MCLSPLVASCWTSRNLEFILGCGGWEDPQRARLSTHDVAGSIGRETQGPAPKKLGFLKCGSSNQVLARYTRLPAVYPSLIKYGCPICNPGCEVLWQASRGDVNRQKRNPNVCMWGQSWPEKDSDKDTLGVVVGTCFSKKKSLGWKQI